MYQWPTLLAGKRLGWWLGWIYACATFPLMTAYYASLPTLIHPLFNLAPSFPHGRDHHRDRGRDRGALEHRPADRRSLGRIAKRATVLETCPSCIVVCLLVTFILVQAYHFGNLMQTATTPPRHQPREQPPLSRRSIP